MSLKCLSLVTIGVFAACAESPVAEPNPGAASAVRAPGAAPARAAAPIRPLRGTCTFVSTPLAPLPGQPANVRRFQLDEVCHLAHLGLTTARAQEIATFRAAGATAAFTTVYTAAYGDQLFSSSAVTATLPDQSGVIHFSGTETVTGGTGRFVDATGSFSLAGSVTPATLTGESELRGSLSY